MAPASGRRSAAPGSGSLGPLVAGVGHSWMHGLRHALAPLDLEPRQYLLLRALATMRGCSQQAVGSSLGIPRSRMVDLIDGLEARGMVVRAPDPCDRRVRALALTAAGSRVLAAADRAAAVYEEERLAPLSPADRTVLGELLARVDDTWSGHEHSHHHGADHRR